jgi:hypothetical protein
MSVEKDARDMRFRDERAKDEKEALTLAQYINQLCEQIRNGRRDD